MDLKINFWVIAILSCTTLFTALWLLDAITHKELVKTDISDPELKTHRNILYSSMLMEISLIGMFLYPLGFLPFFIAAFITRTAHEFIDEIKFHVDRCSNNENMLHLGMWIFILAKTFFQFIWGFFYQYEGIMDLHPVFYIWGAILAITMGIVSFHEMRRSK